MTNSYYVFFKLFFTDILIIRRHIFGPRRCLAKIIKTKEILYFCVEYLINLHNLWLKSIYVVSDLKS